MQASRRIVSGGSPSGEPSDLWTEGIDPAFRERTVPHSREVLARRLAAVPPAEAVLIAGWNAARLYGFAGTSA